MDIVDNYKLKKLNFQNLLLNKYLILIKKEIKINNKIIKKLDKKQDISKKLGKNPTGSCL